MKIKPAGKRGAVTLELGRRDEGILEAGARPRVKPLAIKKILVPIDFSEFSYKSLDYAVAFALQSQAEIVMFHVVPLTYVDAEVIAFDFSLLEKQTAASCESRLQKLRDERVDPALPSSVRVAIGRPLEEIIDAAKKIDADLIVMSTHGYTGLKHAFLGSTTENVVRYAPCPVLTLHEHEHDFVPSPSAK